MKDLDIRIDLGEVQTTLLFPLKARARETEKINPIIYDTYARDIVARIDCDFSKFEALLADENHRLGMVIRAYNFDITILEFLEQNSNAVVMNIGAGLDTTFQRVDNGELMWFNIELPDVAALRQRVVPDSERVITIAKSVFDFTWIEDVSPYIKDRPLMFMAAGTLFYFTESEVETIFRKLAHSYPSAHIVFDSVPWFTKWAQNWGVKKGKTSSFSLWKWHLKRASRLRKWVSTIKVIEEYPIFAKVEFRNDWDKKLVRGMRVTNLLRLYNMAHVKL
ncbi:MAG: class I SAM-dependent methyltransferase [Halobacteriota archaeon]|nr:class I SAM-dependent methyltransferase [Halobacteriota archaeon]